MRTVFAIRRSKPVGQAKISFTFSRAFSLRDGFKYRIVDSMSEWPSHCCTVRRSTPAHRHRVANVERNLCSQKFCLSSFARCAHAFRQSRKSSFGLQPEVGNTSLHVLSDFASHAFNFLTSFAGIGISRSLYAFGVQFRSGCFGPFFELPLEAKR